MRKALQVMLLLLGTVACGLAFAAAGLTPAAGAVGGVVLAFAMVTFFRAASERVAYIAVGVFLLTVTWNGIRIGGGAFGDGFMFVAFAAVVAHVAIARRPVPLPPWLLVAGTGFLLAALLVVIFPPRLALSNLSQAQLESLAYQLQQSVILGSRSNIGALAKFELSLMIVPLLIVIVGTTEQRCRRLIDLWTTSAVISAAVAVLDVAGLHIAPTAIGGHRSSGLTIQPNYLALTCVVAIPTAMLWLGRSRRWTWTGIVAVALLLGGVYASGSRAGTVSAVIAAAATVALVPRLRAALGIALPIAGMVLTGLLFFTDTGRRILHQVRLSGAANNTTGSDTQRSFDAHVALTQFRARPLEGVGFSVITDAHDIYLQLLAAGGLIALSSFAVFCGGLVAAARRALVGIQREAAIAVGIGITVWLINGIFDNQLADKYLYVLPGLLLAVARTTRLASTAPAAADAAEAEPRLLQPRQALASADAP